MNDRLKNVSLERTNLYIRSVGEGPLFAILKLMCIYDDTLYTHMFQSQQFIKQNPKSKKITFLSEYFCRKIMNVLKNYIVERIVTEINANGGYFGIEMDTTPDNSKKEQTSIVLKYVMVSEENGFTIHERTIVFKPVKQLTGKSMFHFLNSCLLYCGLNITNAIGKKIITYQGAIINHLFTYTFYSGLCTDGAAYMSGAGEGLHGHLKIVNPKIIYQWCVSHKFHIAITNACKLLNIATLIQNLNDYAVIAKSSAKRMGKWREIVIGLKAIYGDITLTIMPVLIGVTRWLSKGAALESVMKNETSFLVMYIFVYVISTSKEFKPRCEDKLNTIRDIFCYWSQPSNIIRAHFLHKVFQMLTKTTRYLQKSGLYIYAMTNEISALYKEITHFLNPQIIDETIEDALTFTRSVVSKINNDNEIKLEEPIALNSLTCCVEDVKKDIIKFLEHLQLELQNRYISEFNQNMNFYRSIQNLDPSVFGSDNFDFDGVHLEELCNRAKINHNKTLKEFQEAARLFLSSTESMHEEDEDEATKFSKFIAFLCQKDHQEKYSNILTVYKFIFTLPCTEVRCERDFSHLRYVKTHNRTSMGDQFLENEMIIRLNKEILTNLNIEDIVSRIGSSSAKMRKILLQNRN